MDAALQQIVATVLQLGFPGVVIIGLAWWINKLQARLNDMVDKQLTVTENATKAASDTAAALNRLSDSILRGKTE